MEFQSQAFEKIYEDYLSQIAQLDLSSLAPRLGGRMEKEKMIIPLFGRNYSISSRGVFNPEGQRPIHAEIVVLCKYVLLCPEHPGPDQQWVSFRDFKDAAPFAGSYANNVEKAIAKKFQARLEKLSKACDHLGGYEPEIDLSYELIRKFQPLPKVSMLLLFNDKDEEFPAESSVLFARNAADYLDMECLAILGWLLSDYLNLQAGGENMSIM